MNIRKKRVNDLAIIVIDGKIYNRTGVDDATWLQMLEVCEALEQDEEAEDEQSLYENFEKLLDLIIPERVAIAAKLQASKEKFLGELQLELNFEDRMRKAKRIADISGLFEYDEDGITYLVGFKQPMPKILVEALLDAHYNPNSNYTVDSLVNFWKYLLLNPDKHVRTGLFEWIKTGKFALTDDGNIISYRNVDVKKSSGIKRFQDFVSESWTKIKGQKKSPKNYFVYDNSGVYSYSTSNAEDGVCLGTVGSLFDGLLDVVDNTIYTDNYTKTMNIKLGEVVSMKRDDCDNDPNSSCSKGLHQKSAAYGLNLGSEVLVCLVNPYHVVAIPSHDVTKFRTCQYLPVAKAELDGYRLVEFGPGTYDISYETGLNQLLGKNSLDELKANGQINSELDLNDIKIVMESAKKIISTRCIKLD